MLLGLCIYATTIPPLALEDRVKLSDHIIIGKVESIKVADRNGDILASQPKSTHIELKLSITISLKETIKTNNDKIPDKIRTFYGDGLILGVDNEKKRLMGKEMIFFLKGKDYSPVHDIDFTADIKELSKIKNLLKAQSGKGE